jgi:hypothetical protein
MLDCLDDFPNFSGTDTTCANVTVLNLASQLDPNLLQVGQPTAFISIMCVTDGISGHWTFVTHSASSTHFVDLQTIIA